MFQSDHCLELATPHWIITLLASVLVVGILASYLPQHYKIFSRRTSEGLSPWWVLLGGLSSIAAIGNVLTLPASRADLACCKDIGAGACLAALLGVVQIGVQWSCFMVIVVLYLVFFPSDDSEADDLTASTATLTTAQPAEKRDQLIVGASIFIALLVVALISIVLVVAFPNRTQNWADLLGTVAGVLAVIQYLPQIYYTYVLKDLKSLSLLTLLVQVPGAFLFAFSLFLRVGWAGWSTWLVYIVTGLLQAVLLSMALNYWSVERVRRKERQIEQDAASSVFSEDEEDQDEEEHTNAPTPPTENTPLLPITEESNTESNSSEWTNRTGTVIKRSPPRD